MRLLWHHYYPTRNMLARNGFTLLELIVVIAIIGIIVTIAIPLFLGQREKARHRSIEASARAMVVYLRDKLDDYRNDSSMLFMIDSASATVCYEPVSPAAGESCLQKFRESAESQFNDLGDVLTLIQAEYNVARNETEPYTGGPLINIDTDGTCDYASGQITLCNTTDVSINITAVTDSGSVVYSTAVTSR